MWDIRALLSELRVLDLTDEKGELCGKILADLGAEVIKVEPPEGDPVRHMGPFVDDDPDPEKGLLWLAMNTGKKSVTLNLHKAEGRSQFKWLAKGADLVLESFSPGYLSALGLGYENLSEENPRMIMVAITPFGQTGPFSQYAGPDLIVMAMSGEMHLCGDPKDRPLRISVPQAYFHASLEAVVGALFALWHRRRTGQGQLVDVSAQEAVAWAGFHNQCFWYTNRINLKREGAWRSYGSARMRTLFPCKDGYLVGYLTGGRVGGPSQRAMVRWMDAEGMADDYLRDFDWDSFYGQNLDQSRADGLEARFAPFYRTKAKKELFDRALIDKFLFAPVYTTKDVMETAFLRDRGFWTAVAHAELGRKVLYPGAPYKSSRPHYGVRGPAPRLGQDNQRVFDHRPGPAGEGLAAHLEDAVPEGVSSKGLIFEGLKVLDLSWVVAGPSAVRYFADHGAQVIRVESPSQLDVLRQGPPFKDRVPGVNRSAYFASYNTNKYGITLDLKRPEGLKLVKSLVAWGDVVVESFSPGVIDKLGLGYEALRAIKPDIIMASTSQLGRDAPPLRGFGTQGAALAGFWSLTGYPQGEPGGLYGAYCDFLANRYLIIAIMMALEEKTRTGQGQYIDQSQLESSLHFLAPALLDFAFNGRVAGPQGNRDPRAAPHNAYRCGGEDRWCTIAVFTEEQWEALKGVMGHPAWAEEERFSTLSARKKHEDDLDRLLDQWTSQYPPSELMRVLQEAGVPAGAVARAEDLHNDPQLAHRGHFMIVAHPELGTYASDSPAFRLSKAKTRVPSPAPCLGEHNEFVAKEILGLSHEECLRLKEAGAFGQI